VFELCIKFDDGNNSSRALKIEVRGSGGIAILPEPPSLALTQACPGVSDGGFGRMAAHPSGEPEVSLIRKVQPLTGHEDGPLIHQSKKGAAHGTIQSFFL